jgi:chorismate mutase
MVLQVFEYKESLSLEKLRSALIRQEETIIFSFIERAQFLSNRIIYKQQPGPEFNVLDGNSPIETSFMEYFLLETEKVHAKVRRYTSPEEHAFFPDQLPYPILPSLNFPPILHPNNVNINNRILKLYVDSLIPLITVEGDDGNYGSSATSDVIGLQALSKRIHYGKFIAEAKFQEAPEQYSKLIQEEKRDEILQLLTNATVEQKLLRRVAIKASFYGADLTDSSTTILPSTNFKVDPQVVSNIYENFIIPLTKDVEVEYLMQRLN